MWASWKKAGLDTDELDFETACFMCECRGNQTNLRALLRHIRNALAHGHIYVWKKRGKDSYIFLVDIDIKQKNNICTQRITAKLMLSYTILEKWKAILENHIAIGE